MLKGLSIAVGGRGINEIHFLFEESFKERDLVILTFLS